MTGKLSVGGRINQFYCRIGDRGVKCGLYILTLVWGLCFALAASDLSISPAELNLLIQAENPDFIGTGWLTALVYAPFPFLFSDPAAQYHAALVMGCAVTALTPVLAYDVAGSIGANKAWYRVLAAIAAVLYGAAFCETQRIGAPVFAYVGVWAIFRSAFLKGRNRSIGKAFHCSATCAVFFALSQDAKTAGVSSLLPPGPYESTIIAAVIALLAVLCFERIAFRREPVRLSLLLPGLLTCGALVLLPVFTAAFASDPALTLPAAETAAPAFSLSAVLADMFGSAMSTFGITTIAVCITASVLFRRFAALRQKSVITDISTKKPAPLHSRHNPKAKSVAAFTDFALYGFLCAVISRIPAWFGMYPPGDGISGITPLIMAGVCAVFVFGLDFRKLLICIVTQGVICTVFFLFGDAASKFALVNEAAISPVTFGGGFTPGSALAATSTVFCVIAVFIVVVCCAVKTRKLVLSLTMIGFMMYTCIADAANYLPGYRSALSEQNTPIAQISESVFNSADAPILVLYNVAPAEENLLHFLNPKAKTENAKNYHQLPDSGFLLTPNSSTIIPYTGIMPRLTIAGTDDFTLYAFGERAVAFVKSQEQTPLNSDGSASASDGAQTAQSAPPITTPETTATGI
jgi:hypothetical protein